MSEAFLPTLRRKLTGADPYGLDVEPSQDEMFSANPAAANAYKPSLGTPGITNAPPSSAVQSQQNPYAARLTSLGNQLQSAYAAPHAGAARQLLGALFSRKNPQLGGIISGETQRERQIEPMEKEYGLISNIIAANRAQQTADTTNQMHLANTNYLNKHADVLENPPIKPTPQEEAVKDYMGQVNPATKKNYTPAEALKQVNQDAQDVKPDKTPAVNEQDKAIQDYLGANKLPDTPATRDRARSVLKTRDRPEKDQDIADLGKQIKQAQLEKLKEATPDEQRRADLAGNLEENLNNLEDIARRRPELFGPVHGRATTAKQWIGSSDPDVAALKVIEEQTGLAMVGAHAMRHAQHAEKAAQSITGANKNTADVLLAPNGPIAKARESVATFKADAQRRRNALEGNSPETSQDFGDAGGKPEGSTGMLNGKKIVVKGGRIVAQ